MDSSFASLSTDLVKKVQGDPQVSGEKSENPWGELVQAAAPGADEFQLPDVDLRNPLDHYHRLRTLWALSLKGDAYKEELQKLLRHPLGRTFQPSAAIRPLLLEGERLAPVQFESGSALCEAGLSWKEGRLPLLPELCQLSLLWSLNGKTEAAGKLASWLLPLLDYKTLWASERRYDEAEFFLSAYLLYLNIGNREKAEGNLAEAKKALRTKGSGIDPFFLALEERLHSLDVKTVPSFDPELGLWTHSEGPLKGALTLSGQNTSVGTFKKDSVEICACGPQFYPLTDSTGFGLSGLQTAQKLDQTGIRGWSRCYAQNDVWMELIGQQANLDVRFMGLSSEKKMAFVFYIKAETAQIEGSVFRPKSLARYNGLSKLAKFDSLTVECPNPRKMELIPLAGEGCFWGADFLLAFEINPFEPVASFRLV